MSKTKINLNHTKFFIEANLKIKFDPKVRINFLKFKKFEIQPKPNQMPVNYIKKKTLDKMVFRLYTC